jgi:NADH-quinone oxidoreductase subunit F
MHDADPFPDGSESPASRRSDSPLAGGSRYLLPDRPVRSLDEYLATDHGGLGLRWAVDHGPDAVVEALTQAGLRGRGGGGFPTGRKWAGVRAQAGTDRYVVVNGAEGEPGTFKDRAILRTNPFQVVEGLIIAAYAVGATEVIVGLKASFAREREALAAAVGEMQAAGICRECTVTMVEGPDEYLFGEEKALLEVIEGRPPMPRILPPHEHGLFATAPQLGWTATDVEPGHRPGGRPESNPTLVNNVETLANVPVILARGPEWYRGLGTAESPGNLVCTVVGDVRTPAVAEIEMGTPLRTALDGIGGGPAAGRAVKAVFSGVANAVVTAADLDTPVSYEGLAAVGSGLGAGGFIVYDDTACMVEVARQFSRFLYIESCGQCLACKRGTGEITARLERIEAGTGSTADIAEIGAWLAQVTDGNRCYLPVEEQAVVASLLRRFPEEFDEHLVGGGCPRPRVLPFPKLVDLHDGEVVVDLDHARKRPDWTYGEAPEPVVPGQG